MFRFLKKDTDKPSQKDCDNQKVVATILSKLNDRGFKTTLDNLNAFIPGIKEAVNKHVDEYIEEQYKRGVDATTILKVNVPEREKEILNNKAISALLEFKVKCGEFKEEQKGSGKKKRQPRKTTKKTIVKKTGTVKKSKKNKN